MCEFYEADIKRPEMASDATLRDYFAAKAMQAMISNPSIIDNDSDGAVNYAASAAYKFAGAMLKAREYASFKSTRTEMVRLSHGGW